MTVNPTSEKLDILVIDHNLYVISLEKLQHKNLDIGKGWREVCSFPVNMEATV